MTPPQLLWERRPWLLPEDTKPATCKSDATTVCTATDVLSKRSPTVEPCTFRYLLPRTWQLQVGAVED